MFDEILVELSAVIAIGLFTGRPCGSTVSFGG